MRSPEKFSIIWTGYMKYRAKLRGFDLAKIEDIIRYSTERYFDTITQRMIVVGRHDGSLVMIVMTPINQDQNLRYLKHPILPLSICV